jgi:hypothetical protein
MKGKTLKKDLNRRVEYEQGLIEALQQYDWEQAYTYSKPEPKYRKRLTRRLQKSYQKSDNLMRQLRVKGYYVEPVTMLPAPPEEIIIDWLDYQELLKRGE